MKKIEGRTPKRTSPTHLPRMREHELIVDDGLPDEVLVYDLVRHKAHCLNHTAALVWKNCDGKSTASEIAARVSRKLKQEFPEDAVWLALRQLEKLHLLEQAMPMPPRFAGMSRREMIRNLSVAAAVAIPVVTSIVAPTAADANTCIDSGQLCSTTIRCCSGVCNGTPGNGGVCL